MLLRCLAVLMTTALALPAWAQTCDRTVPTDHATINAGIAAAANGDVVCVQAGTYYETVDFDGKNIHLLGLGGAAGTTIHGSGWDSVVVFENGENASAILEGFTITGGVADHGGGIYVESSDPTLTGLVVTGNHADYEGGGIFAYYCDPTISNTIITENTADDSGGGLSLWGSSVTMDNLIVAENEAEWWGGGLLAWYSYINVSQSNFLFNEADDYGGGMLVQYYSTADLDGVSITSNYATTDGGGLYLSGSSAADIEYCNGWNNSPNNWAGITPTQADGNISVNPQFLDTTPADPAHWDLHLHTYSGLVDAGDPGIADPDGGTADIGAYGGPYGSWP